MNTPEEKAKQRVSWNDVKEKYLKFHKMDKFTENMTIDIDFGYWLANEVIKEALRWRDPNKELPDYYKKVQLKVKHNGKLDYVNACLLVDDDGGFFFYDYNYEIYVQFKHVIGWKLIE